MGGGGGKEGHTFLACRNVFSRPLPLQDFLFIYFSIYLLFFFLFCFVFFSFFSVGGWGGGGMGAYFTTAKSKIV